MNSDTKVFEVPVDTIPCDLPEVSRLLGYPGPAPGGVGETIAELWKEAVSHAKAVCGYRWIQGSIDVERKAFSIQDVTFDCGALITRHLKGSTGIACFAATLGIEFENWSKRFFKDLRDPYQGYISDTIGSVLVEDVIDWLEEALQSEIDRDGLKRSTRLSPGYCHWSVADQHKLFSFLPKHFCGIKLTDSALMIPTKSVSGVMGVGPTLEKRDYGCRACLMTHCIMRRKETPKSA